MDKKWDTDALKAHFNNPADVEANFKIYIFRSFTKDERVWLLKKNG